MACKKSRWCQTHTLGIFKTPDLLYTYIAHLQGTKNGSDPASQGSQRWLRENESSLTRNVPFLQNAFTLLTAGLLKKKLESPCESRPVFLLHEWFALDNHSALLPSFFPDEGRTAGIIGWVSGVIDGSSQSESAFCWSQEKCPNPTHLEWLNLKIRNPWPRKRKPHPQ